MNDMVIEIIIKWIIPTILTGIWGFIIKELKDNRKNNRAMEKSMVAILRSQIVSKCENYINQGYLPDHARFCLEDLFNQYTELGGNHGVGILVEQCFTLPPIKIKKVN